MAIQNLPASTNFQITYEDSIANADIRAQAVAAVCEHEFTVLTGWFGITGAFGTADRINVQLDLPPAGGAWNAGYQSGGQTKIIINPQSAMTNAANAAEIMKMMFVNELVEVFMSYNNQKGANRNSWKANNSDGEALSQLCGIERFRTGHYLAYSSWVDQWLQFPTPPQLGPPRPDWVINPEPTDGNPVSFGCGLLFLYYLKSQLNYSVPQIIQNGGASLTELYKNLTGQSNAWGAFTGLVNAYFPPGNTPPFRTFDDPFPLLDPIYRSVSVDTSESYAAKSKVASGKAHVRPFSSTLCPAKDYSFDIYSTPERVSCTATVRGFGQPVFAWRVNGVDVPAGGGSIGISASVMVDDTTNPQQHATALKNITVSCIVSTPTSWTGALTIDVPPTAVGHVNLIIDALVSDRFVAPAVQTKGTDWTTADNEEVVWNGQYYKDRDACHVAYVVWVKRNVTVDHIPIWRTLPDPPPDYGRVIRQLGLINELLKEARGESREVAETMLRRVYGLTPELVEQITNQQKRGEG
jgi:hypothetical protein